MGLLQVSLYVHPVPLYLDAAHLQGKFILRVNHSRLKQISQKPNKKLTPGTNLASIDVSQDLVLPHTGTSLLCVVHFVTEGDNDVFYRVFVCI